MWQTNIPHTPDAHELLECAECYELEIGCEPNLTKVEIWYTFAANQGYKSAQEKLKELQKKISASTIRFE